jgi:hypothetical protein
VKVVGKLVRAGTMTVSGEEVTGFVIEIPVEVLRALPHLPMYREITLETVSENPASTQNHNAENRSQ